jgi:hypothetical protein
MTQASRPTRRSVLQLLFGTAAAGAVPSIAVGHPVLRHLADATTVAHAQARTAAAGWTLAFLDRHQFDTLQSIAERIVPGAARARSSEFIDQLLAVDSQDDQRTFLSALGAVDRQSVERAGRPWTQLGEQEHVDILTLASTMAPGRPPDKPWTRGEPILPPLKTEEPAPVTLRDHFDLLKGWVVGAYYSSEIGMKELGWTGNAVFDAFPGCDHPGGHAD